MNKVFPSATEIRASILSWVKRTYPQEYTDGDPLIQMLTGALASEMDKLYHQLNEAEERVIEHLAELLLPDHSFFPYPAHSLVQVYPISSMLNLKPDHVTFTYKNSILFTPLVTSKVVRGEVRMILKDNSKTSTKKIALGIYFDNVPISLHQVRFNFSLPQANERESSLFFDAISKSRWTIANTKLKIVSGLQATKESILKTPFQRYHRIREDILRKFDARFITISDTRNFGEDSINNIPSWINYETFKKEEQELLWIDIELPYSVEIPKSVECRLNCIPVINLSSHEYPGNWVLDDSFLKVHKISHENQIFDIKEVTGRYGNNFHRFFQVGVHELGKQEGPNFSIRKSGVGSQDTYNSIKALQYLLHILRQEHIDFENDTARYTEKYSATTLAELHQILQRSSVKYQQSISEENAVYLFLAKGHIERLSSIKVEFWTTMGSAANEEEIPANPQLESENLEIESIKLMAEVAGGKDGISKYDRNYKKLLFSELQGQILTRGKGIVSKAEIEQYSRHFLLQKQINLDSIDTFDSEYLHPELGFTRCVVIKLYVGLDNDNIKYEQRYIHLVINQLEKELNQKSASLLPITIDLNHIEK